MGQRAAAPHGVMESGGSYNLHSAIPAGGAGLALPLLEQAARTIALDSTDQPLVIADYGSSQGKNSLPPLRAAIRTLRGRVGPARPIIVVHVDQPANDFNTLFEVLHADPERYSLDDPNVFPSAIGRSFYESVFPKAHVHLGWSSYAAVWLSRNPARIPGHFVPRVATGPVREAFERQAAEDWKAFLSLRAVELKPGGRLVVVPYLVSRSPAEFAELLAAERVTVLNQTPSAFYQLMDALPEDSGHALRVVIFGGEALDCARVARWLRTGWPGSAHPLTPRGWQTARQAKDCGTFAARSSSLARIIREIRRGLKVNGPAFGRALERLMGRGY